MADIGPEVLDVAKVGGSGVAGGALALLVGRLWGDNSKVLTRLDEVAAQLAGVAQQLAVAVARLDGVRQETQQLRADVSSLQQDVARIDAHMSAMQSRGGR